MSIMDLNLKSDERAEFRLRELYRKYGYTQYKMSKFEEYDLYVRNKNFLVSENILTFTDTDGKLMALKPDVTLSIIKNAKGDAPSLQKVYYNEHVYRTSPTSHGYREIMQTGLECIGDLDLYAISEVVMLAARSLETISTEYLLDLSHLGFVSSLLDELALESDAKSEILSAIGEKNTPAIAAACAKFGVDEQKCAILCRLALLYGAPEQVMDELRSMVCCEGMAQALQEVEDICSLLKSYRQNLRLDFSIINNMSYYNGIIFRGFLPGLPSGVLSGGRYDKLLSKMGKKGGAIGFAVYLDMLERYGDEEPDYDVDVLLIYNKDTDATRVAEAAEALARTGRSVRVERAVPEGLKYRQIKEVG